MSALVLMQQKFATEVSKLILHIDSQGFAVTLGESYRTLVQAEVNALTLYDRLIIEGMLGQKFPDLATAIGKSTNMGIAGSVHKLRLAQDLNLFKDEIPLTSPVDYEPFGTWWKSQGDEYRWGGDWGDADHFSFEHNGVK